MSQRKIVLVVDDDTEIQDLLQTYLPAHWKVHSAYVGKEAVKMYRTLLESGERPDLVVMDLNLSGTKERQAMFEQMQGTEVDGVTAAEEILEIDPDANIVGYTAFADMEWGERLKAVGAKAVYGRDIGFDTFAKKAQQIVA